MFFLSVCVYQVMNPSTPYTSQRLTGNPNSNYNAISLALHGLFVLEHNWWADQVKLLNPTWDDELLYREAR